MLPTQLETERLLLLRPTILDANEVFLRYAQDPEVTRYLRWAPHKVVEQTSEYLQECEAHWNSETGFSWLLISRENQHILGMILLRDFKQTQAELSYVSAREAWGHGYMSEALRAVLETAFASGRIDRVWAKCVLENVASQRVMKKGGMREESRERRVGLHPNLGDGAQECVIFAIEKSQLE